MTTVKNNSSITRILSFLLVLLLFVEMIPVKAINVTAASDESLGKVSVITEGGEVNDTDSTNVIINYSSAVIEWSAQDYASRITNDGWWIGFKVENPIDVNGDAKFQIKEYGKDWKKPLSYQASKVPETNYMPIMSCIDPGILNSALLANENVVNEYQFDWDGDSVYEQHISLVINPKNMILTKDSKEVYSPDVVIGTASVLTDGLSIDGNSGNIVYIENADKIIKLQREKISADNEKLSWKIGFRMAAPNDGFEKDKAIYRSKIGENGWSAREKVITDESTENYIDLWITVNEAIIQNYPIYGNQWKFDWNGDGFFEQTVVLNINTDKLILMDENGEYQVAPELGEITSYNGGETDGVTGNRTLRITDTILDWSAKDEAAGKDEDAWWAGIKVTSPAWDNEILKNSNYQIKKYGESEWSETKSFWGDKDSSDSDDSQYIDLFMPLTPSRIAEAITARKNITNQYRFDWNGDGQFEQTINFVVVPSDKIVLTKLVQDGLAFEIEAPVDQWVGDSYINTASGGKGSGAITYSIIEGKELATIVPTTGKLTFNAPGKVIVRATKAADDLYSSVSCEYTVHANKRPQTDFKFETTSVSITYDPVKPYTNAASGGNGEGAITYEIISGDSATINKATGELTLLKAGQVTVKATKAADSIYNEISAEYELVIKHANQSELEFTTLPVGNQIKYRETAYRGIVVASGGNGKGDMTYSVVSGEDVASISPEGNITTKKEGSFTIQVDKAGDDCYNDATPKTLTIQIIKADQTEFAFTYPEPMDISYNDNGNKYSNPAINGKGTGSVSYMIVDGEDFASIDSDSGELTIVKAGLVTVSATIEADDCYNEKTISYSVNIKKTQQNFTFKDGLNVNKYYGIKSYINELVPQYSVSAADGSGYGTGIIKYELSGDLIGALIDEETGEITFSDSEKKVGKITVTATKEADDCYDECQRSYTVNVSYLPAPAKAYTLDGNKNRNNWYKGKVTILAPNGYKISYNNELSTDDWADSLEYTTEGSYSTEIYLMNEQGSITDKIVTQEIKIENGTPKDLSISYDVEFWEKIKDSIYGIYNGKISVTIAASQNQSRIERFEYKLGEQTVTVESRNFTSNRNGRATYTFKVEPQFRNKISFTAISESGLSAELSGDHVIVLDNSKPKLKVNYVYGKEQKHNEYNDRIYTDGEVTVEFEIDEKNFDLSDAPCVTLNDSEQNVSWTQNPETGKWISSCNINEEGANTVNVTFTDVAKNTMDDFSKTIVIDKKPPILNVQYLDKDKNEIEFYKGYCNSDCYVKVTVDEQNFRKEDMSVSVETDADKKVQIEKSIRDILSNDEAWTPQGNIHTVIIPVTVDTFYKFTLNYTDLAGNKAEEYVSDKFVIDHEEPKNLTIDYSDPATPVWYNFLKAISFGAYNPKIEVNKPLKVTVKADDITSGVDNFSYKYTKEEGTSDKNLSTFTESVIINSDDILYSEDGTTAVAVFEIPAEARGYISFTATDKAGNTSEEFIDEKRINIVDTIAPKLTVNYSKANQIVDAETLETTEKYFDNKASKLYYDDQFTATFIVDEANFYKEDVVISDNGVRIIPENWEQDGDIWTGSITVSSEGDHVITVDYTDRSGNKMESYVSPILVIDEKPPVLYVQYFDKDRNKLNPDGQYYNSDCYAKVTVDEHNFRKEDMSVSVETNTDKNDAIKQSINDIFLNNDAWTHDRDEHTVIIPFTVDTFYKFTLNYTDLAGNKAKEYVSGEFVIDHEAPENLTIDYSDPATPVWYDILKAITFGAYNPKIEVNKPLIVTITACDTTSGVDHFSYTYTKEEGTSDKNLSTFAEPEIINSDDINYSDDGIKATAVFEIPAEARGYISFTATDKAGNTSEEFIDEKHINIVDTIAPKMTVNYSEANQIVDAKTLETIDTYSDDVPSIVYYNDQFTATFIIDEANFYKEDVVISDNGVRIIPENWEQDGDIWTGSITVSNEGDHIITVDYTDRSLNEMIPYTSQLIVIDKTTPVVTVDYSNNDIKNTHIDSNGDERKYFANDQKAVITVKEHNFRADDMLIKVNAVDVQGHNIGTFEYNADNFVTKYMSDGKNRSNWSNLTPYDTYLAGITGMKWRRYDDTYLLEVTYSAEANYTFDIDYCDLAGNNAADYNPDYFTVDRSASTPPQITYSTSILDKIIEALSFGYYQPEVRVTISADDAISGVSYIKWSYTKQKGSSSVNADSTDFATVSADKISYSNNGKTASASFTVLANARGYISAEVYDWSENAINKVDEELIKVVDKISPVAKVTYNEPIQKTNDISYYAGDINTSVLITEANFYSEDVNITVTKEGNNYPVNVNWKDNSVDEHIGTFTLHDDGDYTVTVKYTDRSSNEMVSYVSNTMTVDTKAPKISVSNIKANSANKDSKYSFTIIAEDVNIDYAAFKPVLTAVTRNNNGTYSTEKINLGNVKTIETGKKYSFTVDDLTKDALYSLTCVAKDMSGNSYAKMILDDNKEYDTVKFSINRNGSVFDVDKNTAETINQYYVYNVKNNIVIEEYNVDPIENYTVKLNGKKLVEGTQFSTGITSKEGEWSRRYYVVNKELFDNEGKYNITVESTDKTDTKAYSDVKNLNVEFVVDQTAPVLTISGLENGGRYQVDEQTVVIMPSDGGGRIYSLKVMVEDSNGRPMTDDSGNDISIRFEMSGDELLKYLDENDGKITFTVPKGLENNVNIVCSDCALNTEGVSNEYSETFNKVTVSQNGWVIFYANKPMFYSSIAVLAALLAGIIVFVIYKKRKKTTSSK